MLVTNGPQIEQSGSDHESIYLVVDVNFHNPDHKCGGRCKREAVQVAIREVVCREKPVHFERASCVLLVYHQVDPQL